MKIRLDFQRIIPDEMFVFVRKKLCKYPCLPVLMAVLGAVLPQVFFPQYRLVSILLPVLLTGTGWLLLGVRRALVQLALPAFAGLCGLYFNVHFRQHDSLSELLSSRMAAGAEAEILVCDPSLYPVKSRSKSLLRAVCRVLSVRFSSLDTWQETDSLVIAVFPPEFSSLSYGSRVRVYGELQRPQKPEWSSGFDYGDYLRRRGINFVLSVKKAVKTGEDHSAYSFLLSVRNRLLDALISGLKNRDEGTLAAALLFGCRQEISRESRMTFIRSGTIHILTVSGLHIGMFASAVFLLLLPVPFRFRMLLTPILTLLYAYSTGMQMPALRAVLMLFCWCIPRAFMLRTDGLNSVMLACSLLLIWNPFQLKDAGFQYSFLCVFFLILTAEQILSWNRLVQERQHWIPDRKQTKLKRLAGRCQTVLLSVAGGCLTAWLCSFVLTVYYQGLAVPFAVAANLLILAAVYMVFFLFTVAVLPCLIFPASGEWLFSRLLTLPLSAIESGSRFFSGLTDGRVPVPPVWTVGAGITALWLLLVFPGRKAGAIGLAGLTGLLFFWCSCLFHRERPELMVLYGGWQRIPAFVFSCPENDFSIAANLADYSNTIAAADYLKQRGHSELTLLLSSGAAREYIGGARYFPDLLKVRNFLVRKASRRFGTAAAAAVQKAREKGVNVKIQSGNRLEWSSGAQKIETFSETGEFSFDIWQNRHKVHIRIVPDSNSGTAVWISGADRVLNLPRDRQPGAVRMKLNR